MSSSSHENRWVPFQCPLCFGLFRLRRSQVGSTGHCPTCHSLIRVTDERPEESQTALRAKAFDPDDSLLKRIEVAQPMTAEELAQQERAQQERKRLYVGGDSGGRGWEVGREAGKSGPSWFVIGIGAMALLLVLAGGLFYVKNMSPGNESGNTAIGADSASKAKLDAILDLDREASYLNEDGIDPSALSVDQYSDIELPEVERVVKAFLNSKTVTERSRFVREPERVRVLMLKFYGGEDIEAEGFEHLDKSVVSYQDELLSSMVQTASFSSFPISVERIEKGEDAIYQVDWESWVGYSEFSAEEMRSKQPTTPFEIRGGISKGSYFNYTFSDDREWVCYQLSLMDPEYSFLGYAKVNSDAHKSLKRLLRFQDSYHCILQVRYPEEARSKDQLEIVKVVASGWVTGFDKDKRDE